MLCNPRNRHFYLMLGAEAACFALALSASYLLRFEFRLPEAYAAQLAVMLLIALPLKLCVFLALGLYRGMWRYTSLADFRRLGEAVLLSSALLVSVVAFRYGFAGFSRAVLLMDCALTLLLTGGLRLGIRMALSGGARSDTSAPGVPARRVLVMGAGSLGERLLREVADNPALNFNVLGFLDDDPDKQGRALHGREVLGRVEDCARLAGELAAEEILIAVSHASAAEMRRMLAACAASGLPHRILPAMSALLDGSAVLAPRPLDYQDLLGRGEARLDLEGVTALAAGQTVLVTGCGGSIGSELCRQVARLGPRLLVLMDASEYNLYAIDRALASSCACARVLGSVADEALIDGVFAEHRPSLVLHAAAYKHVPMLEENPWAAVTNNILGARVLMDAAVRHRAARFVTVSTDKAVNPASVMGASKRVTELLMGRYAAGTTRFSAVRFGNVVGSSGSVAPLFRAQIEAGGPVTVTHPEVERFFMSTGEACQLVLQAAALELGGNGAVFVLRMGEPVRMVDLARDMIRLSGRQPEEVEIVFTGLRPGEKLAEELVGPGEEVLETGHDKILTLRAASPPPPPDDETLRGLAQAARNRDAAAIRALLRRIVPEYQP